jgi:hypothetical protein
VAIVLTLVQTKQIIYKNETIQNTVNTRTDYQNPHTKQSKLNKHI